MKLLIITPEYLGLNITKKIFKLNATVTLDTTINFSQEELQAYYNLEEFRDVIKQVEILEPEVTNNIIFTETTNPEEMFITFDNDTTEEQKTIIQYNGIEQKTKQKRGRKPNKK
jgi:hypothetical protein